MKAGVTHKEIRMHRLNLVRQTAVRRRAMKCTVNLGVSIPGKIPAGMLNEIRTQQTSR